LIDRLEERLIDQMRLSVPTEIKNARQIENERDAIISGAQAQAEAMIQAGRERAETLAAEHEIVAKAEQRAEQTLNDARARAESVAAAADAYVLDVLEGILKHIDEFRRTVANGVEQVSRERRAAVAEAMGPGPSDESEQDG
jgi:hypothetical protein